MDHYQPISCQLYDYIEQAATLRQEVVILYKSEGRDSNSISGIVTDIFSLNKEEYLKINNEVEIRLDHILIFDGHNFPQNQTCKPLD